jgi:hypothetical protein
VWQEPPSLPVNYIEELRKKNSSRTSLRVIENFILKATAIASFHKTNYMKHSFLFLILLIGALELSAQLNRDRPSIGTAVLGPMISTTNDGGLGILLSKEISYSFQTAQRLNFELNEKSSISAGLAIQISTCLPAQMMADISPDRGLGSFGFMLPFSLNFNYGCQSVVDNIDKIGFFGGIGYAYASLPKNVDGEYQNSGSSGLYPNLGVIFGFSEKFKMGIKAFSILNHVEGLHPAIGLNVFFITNPKD